MTEKKNYCNENGKCGVTLDDKIYGTDCTFYEPDNHNSCIHASWGTPVFCESSSALKDQSKKRSRFK